ncbi:methionine ABC transporter permease [Fructobacillus papyrifericola]|uniref:ABC transporter permease n=1 Tax=Fructobacillus papyrifericola TaxID=2713172 RepID=A0ABS5QT55_9LACO|nr:methionine ABC transporter permease [Fructobacillus papyrifericola]MBS9336379.1 ABC transporter permease [Fructobacillus papyrifericola]
MSTWFSQTFPNVVYQGWGGDTGWGTAIFQTLFMTFWSAVFGGLLGLIFGIGLVVTGPRGITPNKTIFWILDKIVSIFRAVPFIILLAFIAPFTKALVGTQIGINAALVPLSLGVFPFYARQIQVALSEVDGGIVEAAQAVGASFIQIVFGVYIKEGRSEIIRVSTVTLISLIGLTAMAGAIGAGGLGNMAVAYGYNRFANDTTLVATVLVLIMVLIVQVTGDWLAKKYNHK